MKIGIRERRSRSITAGRPNRSRAHPSIFLAPAPHDGEEERHSQRGAHKPVRRRCQHARGVDRRRHRAADKAPCATDSAARFWRRTRTQALAGEQGGTGGERTPHMPRARIVRQQTFVRWQKIACSMCGVRSPPPASARPERKILLPGHVSGEPHRVVVHCPCVLWARQAASGTVSQATACQRCAPRLQTPKKSLS